MTATPIPTVRVAPPLLDDLLVRVQTLVADVGLSGLEYDFVRTLRLFHVRAKQYEDREESGDVCRREDETELGTYVPQGRFDWSDSGLGDLPATFVRPSVEGACPRYDVQSVFMEWRDYEGVYDFERIDY